MRRFTYFLFVALLSLAIQSASAAVITVNPGGDVAAALSSCADGDIIELSAEGTYAWNAMIEPVAKSFTIRAKAGLASRPIIEAGTSVNFGFTFARNQTTTGSATQTFDGITFDGMMRATTFFVIKCNTGFNVDLVINNCLLRGIANAAVPSNITALTYSNTATNPNPDNLTITNSIFNFNGYGVFFGSGVGRPKNITISNCYFNGQWTKGAIANVSTSGSAVKTYTIDHCTFDGGNAADLSLFNIAGDATSTTTISNCLFINNSGSSAIVLGTGGNLATKCGVFGATNAASVYPTAVADGVFTSDPLLINKTASGSDYYNNGSDGKTIGYYSAPGLSTSEKYAFSDKTLTISQQGSMFTVKGTTDGSYSIFSTNGSHVAEGNIINQTMNLNLDRGIYILKSNGKTAKFYVI